MFDEVVKRLEKRHQIERTDHQKKSVQVAEYFLDVEEIKNVMEHDPIHGDRPEAVHVGIIFFPGMRRGFFEHMILERACPDFETLRASLLTKFVAR